MTKQKKYYYTGFLILLTSLFILERYYFTHFQDKSLFLDEVDSIHRSLGKSKVKIFQMIETGYFNKFFVTNSISVDDMDVARKLVGNIEEVLLFDNNYHLVGVSGGVFKYEDFFEVMSKSNGVIEKEILFDYGLYSIFRVDSITEKAVAGFVAIKWNIQKWNNESSIFYLTPGKNRFYLVNSEILTAIDKQKIWNHFIDLSFHENSYDTIFLNGKWRIYWKYIPDSNYYMGLILPDHPIYSFYSFWIIALIFLMLPISLIKEYFISQRKIQILEKVVTESETTIRNLYSGLEKITSVVNYEGIDIENEKVVSGTVLHDDDLEHEETESLYSVKKDDLNFIFLDPLDDRWMETITEKEEIFDLSRMDQLREKAFSAELLDLIDLVSKGEKKEQISTDSDKFESRDFSETEFYDKSYANLLTSLYRNEINITDVINVMDYLTNLVQADALLLLKSDYLTSGYVPVVTNRGKEAYRNNFYMVYNDSILPFNQEREVDLVITDSLRGDSFFTKRFPAGLSENIELIKIVPIHPYDVDAYLVALYLKNSSERKKTLEAKLQEYQNINISYYLESYAPVVNSYIISDNSHAAVDYYKKIYYEFKNAIVRGNGSMSVLHLKTKENFDTKFYNFVLEKCKEILIDFERCLILKPNHFMIIASGESVKQISTTIFAQNPDCSMISYHYPENGRALYTYLS